MERAVIETFDLLRPEVEPVFVISQSTLVKNYVVEEVRRRGFTTFNFTDTREWPRVAKPRSFSHAWDLLRSVTRANLDVIAAARDCDAIYLTGPLYGFYALATIARFRLERRPVLLAHHEVLQAMPFIDELVSGHIFVSEYVRGETRLDSGVHAVLRHHAESPKIGTAEPAELAGGRNVVCISQMTRQKGIDLLLEAWQSLAPDFPDARLHLVGSGGEDFSLPANVFRWGFREDPGTFLRRADFLVQPTPPSRYRETWGRSAVEAISVGVPVVCFASGALSEVVTHERTGLVCREESAVALAGAMRRYLADSALREQHAQNCLAEATERFSADVLKAAWLAFFTEVL